MVAAEIAEDKTAPIFLIFTRTEDQCVEAYDQRKLKIQQVAVMNRCLRYKQGNRCAKRHNKSEISKNPWGEKRSSRHLFASKGGLNALFGY